MKSEKILIVDDISKNIQILGNILSHKTYDVAYAQSGIEALKLCDKQAFDLILLDIMMPGMDGYEVCEKLKKQKHTKDIPVIFLTAKAEMDSIIKGFEVGGQEYITKPFNSSELLARVQTHLLLQRQRKELIKMNDHLEDLVRERTLQLENANKQLEKLDLAKSNFLSLISHEMRTPLNGIIGLTQLLGQTNIDSNQKEYLNYLTEVSARLVKFTEIALLITRLKTDKYDPDILPVSVDHLITTALGKFKRDNPHATVIINYEKSEKQLLVMVDSELTTIGITMIVENTERFAGIEATLDIKIIEGHDEVDIHFTDNGPGFTKQALDQVFELFSAGDIMHHEGSGLSMATLKLITDVQGGQVRVMNAKNGGAMVILNMKKSKQELLSASL